MEEVHLDRVGCFKYENVKGARSNDFPGHLPEEIKEQRWKRFMIKAQIISERKLLKKEDTIHEVIIAEVDEDGAMCKAKGDAPKIDGNLFIDKDFTDLKQGQLVNVLVEELNE